MKSVKIMVKSLVLAILLSQTTAQAGLWSDLKSWWANNYKPVLIIGAFAVVYAAILSYATQDRTPANTMHSKVPPTNNKVPATKRKAKKDITIRLYDPKKESDALLELCTVNQYWLGYPKDLLAKPQKVVAAANDTQKYPYLTYVLYNKNNLEGFVIINKESGRILYYALRDYNNSEKYDEILITYALKIIQHNLKLKTVKTRTNNDDISAYILFHEKLHFKLSLTPNQEYTEYTMNFYESQPINILPEEDLEALARPQTALKRSITHQDVFTKARGENLISFDREKMIDVEEGPILFQFGKVEGYWASSEDPRYDYCDGKFPFPKRHNKPWAGKDAFLAKLSNIESDARNLNWSLDLASIKSQIKVHNIWKATFRGTSISRLDGSAVGSSQFYDTKSKITWPAGYGSHYVEEHNVIPSREFYRYVINYHQENN